MKLNLDSRDFFFLILLFNSTKKNLNLLPELVHQLQKECEYKKDYKAKKSFRKDYHIAEKAVKK